MVEEKKYKYCTIVKTHTYNSPPWNWAWDVVIKNDKVGRLRLLKIEPSMYLWDPTNMVSRNIGTAISIQCNNITSSQNEYTEKYLSVIGPLESQISLINMWPYQDRSWIRPVVINPGDVLEFEVNVMPSQAVSGIECYFYCTFILEDV